MQNDEHDDNIDLDRVDLGSIGADLSLGVDASAVLQLDNFWKVWCGCGGIRLLINYKYIFIYNFYILLSIFFYNYKHIPI